MTEYFIQNTSDWMACGSFLIALFAILGTFYTYITHERKLKKQTELINSQTHELNKYQLKKNSEEEAEKKKALIKAYAYKVNGGWRIKVCNDGAKATNIRFSSDDIAKSNSNITLRIDDGMLPYSMLNKGDNFDIVMILYVGHIASPIIKLIWDDDFGKNQEREQALNLIF